MRIVWAGAAVCLLLASSATAQECAPIKLSQELPEGREVIGFGLVPDESNRLAFLANAKDEDFYNLYTVPAAGGAEPILFDVGLGGDNGADGLPQISLDGSMAVYLADGEVDGVFELYSIPTTDGGGVPTKLNGPLVAGGDVQSEYYITSDGNTVVYLAEEQTNNEELYRVPIPGGTSVKLNGPLKNTDVEDDFVVSSDGQYVVYRAQPAGAFFIDELYSVSLTGGDPVTLNGDLVESGTVREFAVSPDSTTVAYVADQDTDNLRELYRVPIGGGKSEKVSGPEVGTEVSDFAFSPDGQYIVYLARRTEGNASVIELFSAPAAGGQAVKLNEDVPENGFVGRFLISPDSQRVVFEGTFVTAFFREVASVPIAGGDVELLSGDTAGIDGNFFASITPDSRRVLIYTDTDKGTNVMQELRVSRIAGGSPRTLAGPFIQNGRIEELEISPDSRTVLFSGELENEDQTEVFSASIFSGEVNKISGDLPPGGSVGSFGNDFDLTSDARYAAYVADQETVGKDELWSTDITCGIIFFDRFEAVD